VKDFVAACNISFNMIEWMWVGWVPNQSFILTISWSFVNPFQSTCSLILLTNYRISHSSISQWSPGFMKYLPKWWNLNSSEASQTHEICEVVPVSLVKAPLKVPGLRSFERVDFFN
jgi:hypothetical protein